MCSMSAPQRASRRSWWRSEPWCVRMRSGETRSFSVSKYSFTSPLPYRKNASRNPSTETCEVLARARNASALIRALTVPYIRAQDDPVHLELAPGSQAEQRPPPSISVSSACEPMASTRSDSTPELKAASSRAQPAAPQRRGRSPNPPQKRTTFTAGSVWSRRPLRRIPRRGEICQVLRERRAYSGALGSSSWRKYANTSTP